MARAAHEAGFRRNLLRWFRRHGRDLPWRRTRDPYAILVSEVMLQQTQVIRVLDYYPRFLETFPTLAALARASARQVREVWQGLGYYQRARHLHLAARHLLRQYRGAIPADEASLRALPGIGRYTAGAVLSFAYERRAPAVDSNAARVLRRVFHPRLGGGLSAHRRLWDTATRLLPRRGRDAWTFNQALMELGARVCTARLARCGQCPVATLCRTNRGHPQPVRTFVS
jgi:A/G-specific adenine glycosylase